MTEYKVTRRGRFAIILVVVVVVAIILGGAGYGVGKVLHHGGGSSSSAKDYAGSGTGSVKITITSGETLSSIGDTLLQAGVVASTQAFTDAANADTRATGIQPGTYALHSHMSGVSALDLLLDPKSKVQSGFTIPEGASTATKDATRNIAQIINRGTGIPLAQLQAVIAKPSELKLPSYAAGHVEGFLFPATYDVQPGTTAVQALQMMVDRFTQAATATDLVPKASALGITPLQAMTIASVIQRETAAPADGAKVARVFYNRLKAGLGLGSQFTYEYAGGDPNSPYNTYTNKGYPPAPYDSPGQEAITSALNPAAGTWLYFITLPKEGTEFVDTEDQFFALQKQCQNEGGCKSS